MAKRNISVEMEDALISDIEREMSLSGFSTIWHIDPDPARRATRGANLVVTAIIPPYGGDNMPPYTASEGGPSHT